MTCLDNRICWVAVALYECSVIIISIKCKVISAIIDHNTVLNDDIIALFTKCSSSPYVRVSERGGTLFAHPGFDKNSAEYGRDPILLTIGGALDNGTDLKHIAAISLTGLLKRSRVEDIKLQQLRKAITWSHQVSMRELMPLTEEEEDAEGWRIVANMSRPRCEVLCGVIDDCCYIYPCIEGNGR
jgi:hypothetical protein